LRARVELLRKQIWKVTIDSKQENALNKESLEDYEQEESSEHNKLLESIERDHFDLKKDRFPSDERFINIKRPVAVTSFGTMRADRIWAQIPFCGSLILAIPPYEQRHFEEHIMKITEIPKIIEYIKETGKLQVALSANPRSYQGLDHLDPFLVELRPPFLSAFGLTDFVEEREIRKAKAIFETIGDLGYFHCLRKKLSSFSYDSIDTLVESQFGIFASLELMGYPISESIRNMMVDSPDEAIYTLALCGFFLVEPMLDLRSDLRDFTFDVTSDASRLLNIYQPQKYFPYEIGKFLLSKLTYAAQSPEACRNLMDSYAAYDLQKVLRSLNEAILISNPEIVEKSAEDLSDILENVWSDKTIPKRIDNIKIGVPVSIAAVGSVVGGIVGGFAEAGTGGLLAELGFRVAEKAVEKFYSVKGAGLPEKLAKLRSKSYQANVYDFKKKYKGKIAQS